MEIYKFYINANDGNAFVPTEEQFQQEPQQILCIAGIEALVPPKIWVGPYNGEMIFHPCNFETLDKSKNLSIKVGSVTITGIDNPTFQKYVFSYTVNGDAHQMETNRYVETLQKLSQL